MRIRFLSDQIYETSGPGKGPKFPANSTLAAEDVPSVLGLKTEPSPKWVAAFLNRWLQRGVAVEDVDLPSAGAAEEPSGEPIDLAVMTRAELDAHAATLGIDTSKASTKAEAISLIEAVKNAA